ncbi:hypothetical protein [Streptomyces sp. CNZ748]|uniref:hypothetical protein n=1 Tax=Streptomyces sp. CNZ748 TaxID=2885160 RepID=UPI001E532BC5|nr:hypothetical protein [Streptomyces sp. CNZ748]
MRYGDDEPRYLGEADGKAVYVVPAPGGPLEALADVRDIETAQALSAVVRAVLEGEPTPEESAAFVGPLVDALDRVIAVAARGIE